MAGFGLEVKTCRNLQARPRLRLHPGVAQSSAFRRPIIGQPTTRRLSIWGFLALAARIRGRSFNHQE
jgi:hypothetical protein